MKGPGSLKVRLIGQLLLLQVGILFLFGLFFVASLVRADLEGVLADPEITEIAGRAIARNGAGRLEVRDTPELRQLRSSAPEFWFIARASSGEQVQAGEVPPVYQEMSRHLDRVRYAEIRDSRSPYRLSAVVREVSGPEGKLTVLGGGPLFSLTFVVLLLSNLLMLPILALLALIIVLAIPWIVRRSFAGLAVVARQAEEIDIGRRGTRLPDERIPAEVKPLVKAINGALQRLDEGYERHQRFIADAAHELRTPIAILQTRIESMADGALRHRLLADTGRIAALAEQLLDLQRLDRPGVGFTRLDLVTLARRVVADLAPLAIAHGYNLSFESETEHVPVQGDAGALERALLNIVQNAIEHSGRSGDIQVLVGRDGSVSVSDQGPGIPEAERERIFEPFHRLHPRNQGAGLGLNLVREILAHHGGQVVVLDSPGGGACFRISLPCRGEPTTSGL